jgi:DNA-binding XRE family transcriptional regulator
MGDELDRFEEDLIEVLKAQPSLPEKKSTGIILNTSVLIETGHADQLVIEKDDDDESISVFKTRWYKAMKASMGPGGAMGIYRELHGLTQEDFGEKLGGIPRQHICNIERGRRPISMPTAKNLAKLFSVPADRLRDLN